MAQSSHNAKAEVTGDAVSMSGQTASVVSGTSNEIWEVDDRTKDVFDPSVTHTVEVSTDGGSSWSTLPAAEFELLYLIGRIDISGYSGTISNVTDVRISGQYLPKYERGEAHAATHEKLLDLSGSSQFGDGGERREPIRSDFNASLDDYDRGVEPLDGSGGSEDSMLDRLQNGGSFLLSIQPDRAAPGVVIRSFVKLATGSTDLPGDDLEDHSFDVEGDQQSAAMSSQSISTWNYRTPP